MNKKYCITSLSVDELKRASDLYGGLALSSISSFDKNEYVYEKMQDSWIDVLYVFSRLVNDEGEFGGVLSGNVFITNSWIFWVNERGIFERISENSTVYIFRTGDMPKSFISFFAKYAQKCWGIRVVTNFVIPADMPLSSKCHAPAYLDTDNFPVSVVPYVCSEQDFIYLTRFIRESGLFQDSVIAKKAGYSSGDGIKIFKMDDSQYSLDLQEFLTDSRLHDYIIMQLLETADTEYRAYWVKKDGKTPKILEVHGKERIDGHVLHNIAKWNVLRKLDINILPDKIQEDILSYCRNIPESHGGLDILVGKDGVYYFTENNIMTGYLSEPEEQYFAKDWLEAVASCYK